MALIFLSHAISSVRCSLYHICQNNFSSFYSSLHRGQKLCQTHHFYILQQLLSTTLLAWSRWIHRECHYCHCRATLLHHHRQIIDDHFRAFRHCCQHNLIHNTIERGSIVKPMHQMRKYRELGCNTIKYGGIGRLSGVASTALTLCRAWQRCLRDSSERTGKEAGVRMKSCKIANCDRWRDFTNTRLIPTQKGFLHPYVVVLGETFLVEVTVRASYRVFFEMRNLIFCCNKTKWSRWFSLKADSL